MKKVIAIMYFVGCWLLTNQQISAQGFLKKLKDKASDVTNRALDKKVDKSVGIDPAGSSTGSSSGHGGPSNKMGEGLKNTPPPDVNARIAEAETAQAAGNLSDARYATEQALMGVELQLGKQVLQSLPSTVSGLAKDTTQDVVTSTQWGWANLMIQRVYKKDDKQFTVLVGNNPVYSGFMNMFFNGAYNQSNGETQNFKQIKVKGNKAVIKFDKDEGYTLLVQLGQAAMITFAGVNFATENDMMNAANSFDIDGIKKMLGEK